MHGDPGNNFLEEMRAVLKKQLAEFETKQLKAKVLSDEGRKKWLELINCLEKWVHKINDGLPEGVSLSYPLNNNELTLRHELSGHEMKVTFDPASGSISYDSNRGKGKFHPSVQGNGLAYEWDETTPCDGAKVRSISFDERPVPYSISQMSEIILRCIVLDGPSQDHSPHPSGSVLCVPLTG